MNLPPDEASGASAPEGRLVDALVPAPPVDTVTTVVNASIGGGAILAAAALATAETVGRTLAPVARFLLNPPLVPRSLKPQTTVDRLAVRGGQVREVFGGELDTASQTLVPAVSDAVVERMNLTDLVLRRVDLNRIVTAVLDRLDLTELVLQRVDIDRVIAAADLDAAAARLDVDAVAARLDIDAVVERMDLTELVLARVDLNRVVVAVLDGMDLTELVLQRVDLDRVVVAVLDGMDLTELVLERVDLNRVVVAVLDGMDLTELVLQRVDLDRVVTAVLDGMDLTDLVIQRVDIDRIIATADLDAAAARLDVDAVAARLDLVGIADYIIDAVDLPQIIRSSTGSVAAEAVKGARMQGMDADEQLQRVVDKVLLRRRGRSTDAPGDVEAGDE